MQGGDAIPATSKAQFRFMQGVKSGSIKSKSLTPAQAAEYVGGQENYSSLPKRVPNARRRRGR